MASNRLERVGTIFSRITGLLRSGAIKLDDKPLWYDIYKHHPPKYQPKFNRAVPNIDVQPIFYPEDVVRARIQKEYSTIVGTVNLGESFRQTNVQKCLVFYNELRDQNYSEDDAIKLGVKKLSEDIAAVRGEKKKETSNLNINLAEAFVSAKNEGIKVS